MVKLGHNVTTVTGNTGTPDPLGNGITGGFKSLTNTYKRIYPNKVVQVAAIQINTMVLTDMKYMLD